MSKLLYFLILSLIKQSYIVVHFSSAHLSKSEESWITCLPHKQQHIQILQYRCWEYNYTACICDWACENRACGHKKFDYFLKLS